MEKLKIIYATIYNSMLYINFNGPQKLKNFSKSHRPPNGPSPPSPPSSYHNLPFRTDNPALSGNNAGVSENTLGLFEITLGLSGISAALSQIRCKVTAKKIGVLRLRTFPSVSVGFLPFSSIFIRFRPFSSDKSRNSFSVKRFA